MMTTSFSTQGEYTATVNVYSDPICAVPDYKLTQTGTYVIPGGVVENSGMKHINMTLQTLDMTVFNASTASDFNTTQHCGINDWTLGQSRNLLNATCGGEVMPSANTPIYDIYYIEPISTAWGSQPGSLMFGYNDASHDGKTEATRPEVLSGNVVYSK
ncbi:hypothetical protein QJS83_00290 [Bdellovibrio sp. 22V]|uniref:hypothetical protein n=1 Tax=Bdellovibrio TaxID=958 RepID=UPI00254311C3|nr:hypothetical protein [Bdellovibrio sp. 22V]WII72304.1 hypothetical protein QJS83_00290 [Bdellovibrio sp. 22V]